MLDIRKIKPTKGRLIIKLLGAYKEELVDGIIIPAKDKMSVKEGVIVKLPDDLKFKDLSFNDTPERTMTLNVGDVVLLNFLQTYAMFEAIDSDEPESKPETFVSATPDVIISVYKSGQFMKLDNKPKKNAARGRKSTDN